MKYELWMDKGDNRYAVKTPVKYTWLEAEPIPLRHEMSFWVDTEFEDSLGELEADFFNSLAGELVYVGEFDTYAEAYEIYQMEVLLNA